MINDLSNEQQYYILTSQLFGYFLIGLANGGAYLSQDPTVKEEVTNSLDKGARYLARNNQLSNSIIVSSAAHNAQVFGYTCAQEAAKYGETEVVIGFVGNVKRYICPLAPFC